MAITPSSITRTTQTFKNTGTSPTNYVYFGTTSDNIYSLVWTITIPDGVHGNKLAMDIDWGPVGSNNLATGTNTCTAFLHTSSKTQYIGKLAGTITDALAVATTNVTSSGVSAGKREIEITFENYNFTPGTYYVTLLPIRKRNSTYGYAHYNYQNLTLSGEASYTVSYNKGTYGTGTNTSATKIYGTDLTLSDKIFTRTGYTQTAWASNAAGTTKKYKLKATYSANAAITLYPYWTANTYKVTFDANGGSVTTTTKNVTYASTYGTLPTPTRAGHSFNGWYTAKSGGTHIQATTTVSITAAQTLYAQWTINTYKVSYAANGGTSTPAEQTKTYNVDLTLAGAINKNANTTTVTTTFDPNGGTITTTSANSTVTIPQIFNGWKATNGTIYAASGTYTANAATTMTAQWVDGTLSGAAIALPTPTREGHIFDGWYSDPIEGTKYTSYAPITNTTLYAHWILGTYSVEVYNGWTRELIETFTGTYNSTMNWPRYSLPPITEISGTTIAVSWNGDFESEEDIYNIYQFTGTLSGDSECVNNNLLTIPGYNAIIYLEYSHTEDRIILTTPNRDNVAITDNDYILGGWGREANIIEATPGSVLDFNYTTETSLYFYAVWQKNPNIYFFHKKDGVYQLGTTFAKIAGQWLNIDACFVKQNNIWMTLAKYLADGGSLTNLNMG